MKSSIPMLPWLPCAEEQPYLSRQGNPSLLPPTLEAETPILQACPPRMPRATACLVFSLSLIVTQC